MRIQSCEFPEDVFFDIENDIWIRPLSSRILRVGITSIFSFLAGPVQEVRLKKQLSRVVRSQSIATIESAKYFGAIRSPIEGRIISYNEKLEVSPRLINDSPYEKGWVAELEPTTDFSFVRGKDAEKELYARMEELKVRCFAKLPDEEMFAIGVECAATLANLNQNLSKAPLGRVVHLVTDDQTADIEMIRWAAQTKNALLESRREGNLLHFLVEKTHD